MGKPKLKKGITKKMRARVPHGLCISHKKVGGKPKGSRV